MRNQISSFLGQVLARRFEIEGQRWFHALSHAFDIVVVCHTPEVLAAVLTFVTKQAQASISERNYDLSIVSHSSGHQSDACLPCLAENRRSGKSRSLQLTLTRTENDLGSIVFELPTIEALLPSPASMVTLLLEGAGLGRFIDAFDGRKMAQLRKILELNGVEQFFDAVIQVAYLAGFKGDDAEAHRLLERVIIEERRTNEDDSSVISGDCTLNHTLVRLFETLINFPDPHDVMKATLAHYVFHRRNVSQAEASRILKVSRSTLQAHLQMAERLNVAGIFKLNS
ncbi:hypothetical protein EBU99_01125 [bacterium]|nr:hypothetical protein [bacterium]